MADAPADQALFSYGTLQLPEVQRAAFGRLLASERDALAGYRIDHVEIDDDRIVELSGRAVHPILRHTGHHLDKVVGHLLWLTEDEVDAADEYLAALCRRAGVTLESGRRAWTYLPI